MSENIDQEEYQNRFDEMLETLRDAYGSQTVMKLDGTSGLWPADRVIRTGSLDLDMAIGIGGWPRGRLVQVHGAESSGKTTLAIMTIKQAQEAGLLVAVIDAENTMDPNWMRRHGVDCTKVIIIQPAHLEQSIDILIDLFDKGVDLVVLDSIAALKSKEIMGAAADKETRALEARRWSAQLPRIIQALRESQYVEGEDEPRPGSLGLFINQKRESMDMYKPASTPGGKALKYNMSVIVDITPQLEGKRNDEGIDYHISNARCVKNKVGSPFKLASWTLYTNPNNDVRNYLQEAIDTAGKYEVMYYDIKADDEGGWNSKKGWRTFIFRGPVREYIESQREEIEAIEDAFDKGNLFYDEEGDLMLCTYQQQKTYDTLESFGEGFYKAFEQSILETLNKGDGTDATEEEQYLSDEGELPVDPETGELLGDDEEAYDNEDGDEDNGGDYADE